MNHFLKGQQHHHRLRRFSRSHNHSRSRSHNHSHYPNNIVVKRLVQSATTTSTFIFSPTAAVLYKKSIDKKSSKRFFASAPLPLDESREQARVEHLKGDKSTSTSSSPIEPIAEILASTPERKRLRDVLISEVLKSKHTLRWVEPTIDKNSTIREAISTCIDRKLSAMMVLDKDSTSSSSRSSSSSTIPDSADDDDDTTSKGSIARGRGKVVGLATPRDLLRAINAGFMNHESDAQVFDRTVGEFMTPITKVIYARPEETIGTCRSIIAKLGVKCLPILSSGRVEGLITARDMAEYGIDATERGGKKHYLENKSERVGLSTNTSMAEPPAYIRAHLAQQRPLFMNVGMAELPHPYKTPESCGMTRRDYGPDEIGNDCDLSEDAYFIKPLTLNDDVEKELTEIIYVGVADGVGSWREYEVDPREFSHSLMQECENILREIEVEHTKNHSQGHVVVQPRHHHPDDNHQNNEKLSQMLTPVEIMGKAMDRVKADNIIGSSTACIAMFDGIRHQLHFSNLGDSGIIVLRHIDSDVAGTLKRDKTTPRTERTSDLRVAFLSQQQLRSFNHPFQLGWTGEEICGEDTSFKSAVESCTTSIHIRRGDIIIMATDGLFDNVDLEDITKIALEWEQQNGFIVGNDISSREKRWRKGASMTAESAESIDELAQKLVAKARENSLDSSIDSPFAILAKENDIMWSGGMPDDCTVVAMHVVGQAALLE